MTQLEFCFDVGSPWTYLAFHRVLPLAEARGVDLVWRPILVGGVFNAVNESVYQQRANPVPAKARYMQKDLRDWAEHLGLAIRFPPSIFPINSVKAMRACLVAREAGCLPQLARALFEAYWGDDLDIARDEVLAAAAESAGLPGETLLQRIVEPEVKRALRDETQTLIDRGGFGSPTFFVNGDDMYFGNDRLPLVIEALRRRGADV